MTCECRGVYIILKLWSGTLKIHERKACSPGDQNTVLVLTTKKHLAANGDNSCCQGSCECLQMGSDVLVCTVGQVTGPTYV